MNNRLSAAALLALLCGSACAQDAIVFAAQGSILDLHHAHQPDRLVASVSSDSGPLPTVLSINKMTGAATPIYSGPLEVTLAPQPHGPGGSYLCNAVAPNGDHLIVSVTPGQPTTTLWSGTADRAGVGYAGPSKEYLVFTETVTDPVTQEDRTRVGRLTPGVPNSAIFYTPPMWDAGSSCVSPDCLWVSAIRDDGQGFQVYLFNVSGGPAIQVTEGPGIRLFARWDATNPDIMAWTEADDESFAVTRIVKGVGVLSGSPQLTVVAVSAPGGTVGQSVLAPDGSQHVLVTRNNGAGDVGLNVIAPAGQEAELSARQPVLFGCLPDVFFFAPGIEAAYYLSADDATDESRIYFTDGSQPCYADCDGSGTLDFFDFLCFQNEFTSGTAYADCDGSGALDFFDFLCFQNAFTAGCP